MSASFYSLLSLERKNNFFKRIFGVPVKIRELVLIVHLLALRGVIHQVQGVSLIGLREVEEDARLLHQARKKTQGGLAVLHAILQLGVRSAQLGSIDRILLFGRRIIEDFFDNL